MKVGIFIYSLSGGGAERVVSYLLEYCQNNNIDTCLVLMSSNIKYQIPDGTEIHYLDRVNGDESGIVKALKIPKLAYRYAKLAKQLKLTHSLSFLTRPSIINILSSKLTNYKYNIITNERAYPSLQYGYNNFQSVFNKFLIRNLYKRSDIVISNSHGSAKDLISNFEVPKSKMKVIHNPIDLEKIEEIDPISGFFDKNNFNIVTVGRLDIGKNHALLIESISQLKIESIKLYIFGDGNLRSELETLIADLGLTNQVFLMGFDSNPYKYLKAADLFIFGSNHEGFPNVLLEAMACNLPILTTNCKSGPDEIMELKKENDGIMKTNYGLLVPIKDLKSMIEGISYFLNNKDFLESCRNNVGNRVKDFKRDIILKEYIDTVNSVST